MALKNPHSSPAEEQAKETFDRIQKPAPPRREKEKLQQVNFRIEPSAYEVVVDFCRDEYGLAPGAAMRFIVREFMKNHNLN